MRQFLIGLCCIFLLAGGAVAAPVYPELTGRVVDEAHVLSPSAARGLTEKLAAYEAGTSTQLVVVTLPSLDGEPIEQYGVELGRRWQIGQKGTNNGALLIVALKEHEVRIEVGYGLEGVLTDAQSSMIINQIMIPEFQANHPDRAIIDGTKAVMLVLGGKGAASTQDTHPQPQHRQQASHLNITEIEIFAFLVFVVLFIVCANRYPNAAEFFLQMAFYIVTSGGGRGNNDGGGFSGGGGSFGGGGASGRW